MELTSQQIRAILSLGQKLLEKGEVQDDFGESAAIVSQMDGESYDWAIDFLYKAITHNGPMTPAQQELWDELMDIYWDYQEPDDKGAFDAWA